MIEIRKGTLEDVSQVAGIYEHILDKEEAGLSVTGWIRGDGTDSKRGSRSRRAVCALK